MPRNIVLLSDGTGNSEDGVRLTNIAKLHLAIKDMDTKGQQIVFYDQGVATSGDPATRAFDFVTGTGIKEKIIKLYQYLITNYQLGDKIYLFGFSRGAATVRGLTGMIRKVGIVCVEEFAKDQSLVEKAYQLYNNPQLDVDAKEVIQFRKQFSYFDKGDDPQIFGDAQRISSDVAIQFLGAYDTVKALGIPKSFEPVPGVEDINRAWFGFYDIKLNRMIKYARHALAVDERRIDYTPEVWQAHSNTNSEQRWFPGVHCDIGGGYQHHGLADGAYMWMMGEAIKAGLMLPASFFKVNRTPKYVPDSEESDDEKSMNAEQKQEERENQTRIHPNCRDKIHNDATLCVTPLGDVEYITGTRQPHKTSRDETIDVTVRQRQDDPRRKYVPAYLTSPTERRKQKSEDEGRPTCCLFCCGSRRAKKAASYAESPSITPK